VACDPREIRSVTGYAFRHIPPAPESYAIGRRHLAAGAAPWESADTAVRVLFIWAGELSREEPEGLEEPEERYARQPVLY
jgi:hypothetical protein